MIKQWFKSFIHWTKSWWTMKRLYHSFTDVVSGKGVYIYEDCFGDRWMANYWRWGFRVKKEIKNDPNGCIACKVSDSITHRVLFNRNVMQWQCVKCFPLEER